MDKAWELCPNLDGCQPPTCPGQGDCCSANGTPFCNNASCCNIVCDLDPYCCEVEWDECCAKLAAETCPDPTYPGTNLCDPPPMCGPGNGPCNQANGTPGCNDAECCAAVCACDPFCCDVTWDASCAGSGEFGCGTCDIPVCMCDHCDTIVCDPTCAFTEPQGDCFTTGGTGCFDFQCCESVCACDPFCCSFEWDAMCVGPNLDVPGCSAINLCCHLIDCNPADLTGDNKVNGDDLMELLSQWGLCPGYGEHCPDPADCPADFTGPPAPAAPESSGRAPSTAGDGQHAPDGKVNGYDLLFLLSHWGGG